ncbi:MAG: hypothetical protein PHG16_11915 [Lachnospiraceae bacterium]|nr:hypothetical protein [Lachnospiraceae bacterium]
MGLQATNAGIDFQQRVSAYMMMLMEFDMDISLALQLNRNDKIEELNFESSESIDDLVITLDSGKRIYFQAKRTISLSDSIDSEFYGVCTQFVKQYLKQNGNDIAYILATRSETSKSITVKLKRILEGIRLANNLQVIEDLNQEERKIFDKICNNIKRIYKDLKKENISDENLLNIFLRIYIEMFDIENGEEYEKTIKLILFNLISVDAELFWRTLISKAVEYGANRIHLSKQALKEQCRSYLEANKGTKSEFSEQFFKVSWKGGFRNIEVQVDYVIAIPTKETEEAMELENKTVFVFELYRFDNSKKKDSLKYIPPDRMKWKEGFEFEVWFRCATKERCHKYVEHELSEKIGDSYEVVVWPIKEHFDCTDVEILHKDVLLKSLDNQKECICANCGKAIFDDDPYLIEIDNEECSDMVGMVHHNCIRPVDRIVGEIIIPQIEDFSYLKHFDINTWGKLIKKGKQAWNNIEKMATRCPQMTIDTDEVFHDGNYCLYHILENGDKKYLTNRGVIDRISKREAELLQQKFTTQMKEAKAKGNPFGYSSKSFIYGPYAQIIEQVGDREEFIECVETKVALYNEFVARIYNDCETYYAPIIYLSVDGEPFILPNDFFPMVVNPFELPKYIKNWEKMGFAMPDYEVCIIRNDNEFILKMVCLITNHILPVVNGMFGSDGSMIRGIHMHLMWELQMENARRSESAAISEN